MIKVKIANKNGAELERELPTDIHQLYHDMRDAGISKPPKNILALCGGYVLARRFGISTENVLFQREVFPEIPGGNAQEKCGAVRDLLSSIIRASGMAGQEIQKGITELERDMGLYIASPRYRPEEARAV